MGTERAEKAEQQNRDTDADCPNGQQQRYQQQAGDDIGAGRGECQNLQADQDEKHGVENLIDQFPEGVPDVRGSLADMPSSLP